jgi:hypothetical protein
VSALDVFDAHQAYELGVRAAYYDWRQGSAATLVGQGRWTDLPHSQWFFDGYGDLLSDPDPAAFFARVLGVSPPAFGTPGR